MGKESKSIIKKIFVEVITFFIIGLIVLGIKHL